MMNKNLLIKIFGVMGLVFILGVSAMLANAQTSVNLQYPEFTQASGPADFINKAYNWSLGIAGTLAVIMIVYGGIKYAVSAGNVAQQSDAKSIITSAIWGMVLLAGAYLILYTINPNLVDLSKNEPVLAPIPAATSTETGNPVIDDRMKDAQLLISHTAGRGDCGPNQGRTSSYGVLSDVANGKLPMICSNGCTPSSGCSEGGGNNTTLNISMLDGLVSFYNCISSVSALEGCDQGASSINVFKNLASGIPVSITSLTGGSHAATSRHYSGRAVDLVIGSSDPSVWDAAVDVLQKNGATAWCEDPSKNISEQKTSGDCEQNIFSGGNLVSRAHIHAQW